MAAPLINIEHRERLAVEILTELPLKKESMEPLGVHFGSILSGVFQRQEKETGFRNWCVDDLWGETLDKLPENITLSGRVFWLSGGGTCTLFKLDIARNTEPLLYSYKLLNSKRKQELYVGKSYKGWIIKA